MSDASLPSSGSFVWYDLLTTDPPDAVAFYKHVVGWESQDLGPDYTVFAGEQGPVGGATSQPERAKKAGAPPGWVSNVRVADVDAAVLATRKLGGRVLTEPSDHPKLGRLAVIADPQGAPIKLLSPVAIAPIRARDPNRYEARAFAWSTLLTTEHEAALRFYAELFGWKKQRELDMGPGAGPYLIFGIGDQELGGMFTKPKEMPAPPHWIYYVHVEDLDAAIERAKAKGGTLVNGPIEVPGSARVAHLDDPQGGGFGLHAVSGKKG
jgi:predicted enzyme related to lactoylglutathione lyase